MAKNPLTKIPHYIIDFKSLEYLDLWSSQLDEIDPSIKRLKSLKKLDIRATYLSTRDVLWLETARPDLELLSTYGCDCDR